jgi:pyruvate,orthophosphate dikinase
MLHFWLTKEKDGLEEYLPPDIYMQVAEEGPYFDGVHELINELFQKKGLQNIKDLLDLDINALKEIPGIRPVDKERLELSVIFYRLLVQKYSIDSLELEGYVNQLPAGSFPELNLLQEALKQEDSYTNK